MTQAAFTTAQLKERFFAAIEQNQSGQLNATDAKDTCLHLFGMVQEASENAEATEDQRRLAALDRFELHQSLRQLGVDVAY